MSERHNVIDDAFSENWKLVDHTVGLCLDVIHNGKESDSRLERTFAELDDILMYMGDAEISAVRRDPRYRSIRESFHLIRAAYEYSREMALAEAIVAARRESMAEEFRSADWYEAAQSFEVGVLTPYRVKRLLWIGAGPFPTSALYLVRANPELSIACVDRDAKACAVAREVIGIYDCPAMEVVRSDALELFDFSRYDCVLVGLVVGVAHAEKSRVVRHFLEHVPPSTLLAFRTAVGAGTIIYPSVDLDLLRGVDYRLLPDPPQKLFSMIVVDRSS